jgi:hypothetical protein
MPYCAPPYGDPLRRDASSPEGWDRTLTLLLPEEGHKMPYYAQTEVSETWDRLRAGDDRNSASIVTDGKYTQALRISIAVRYRDQHANSMSAGYLRLRGSEESTWGEPRPELTEFIKPNQIAFMTLFVTSKFDFKLRDSNCHTTQSAERMVCIGARRSRVLHA